MSFSHTSFPHLIFPMKSIVKLTSKRNKTTTALKPSKEILSRYQSSTMKAEKADLRRRNMPAKDNSNKARIRIVNMISSKKFLTSFSLFFSVIMIS